MGHSLLIFMLKDSGYNNSAILLNPGDGSLVVFLVEHTQPFRG